MKKELPSSLIDKSASLSSELECGNRPPDASSRGRLLVMDQDTELRPALARRLRLEGYTVDEASDTVGVQKLLREQHYELIALDLLTSGYSLLEYIKEDPTLKWVPLVVLSGKEDLHDKIRCYYLGADDYILKPFAYEEWSARIYSLLKRARDYEQLAFRDPLTGAYNRRYFEHQIRVELKRIARYPAPISMAFLDIDRFKSINDEHGHHAGDIVLQGLAHLLQKYLRATDLVARFGGEEFVVVLPGSSAADAQRVVQMILHKAHTEPVAQHEGQAYYITFSAGVCGWQDGWELDAWIQRADSAMYTAKQRGRNRVLLYEEGMLLKAASLKQLQEPPRKRVLIADEDRILRSILVSKLQHLAIDFVEAADGVEAMDHFSGPKPFDLCILDAQMPGMDGVEVLEKLEHKEAGQLQGLRILFLSGGSRTEGVQQAMGLGIAAYLHKPFSMIELEVKVKELLGIT